MAEAIHFCTRCGARVNLRVPPGDDRPRPVCDACGNVHYQNPKLVAGCLPAWGDQVLLCRRAIEPRYGLWTLPAGYMENGETTREAAIREALEEANARVEIVSLYSLLDLPHIDQVYCLFLGRLVDLDFSPGSETLETRLFGESEIPWGGLAFTSIARTLRYYFEDRRTGEFRVHTGTVRPPR